MEKTTENNMEARSYRLIYGSYPNNGLRIAEEGLRYRTLMVINCHMRSLRCRLQKDDSNYKPETS